MPVESNLILKTSVPKPTSLSGFTSIKKGLEDISDKLTEITTKAWTIRVGLDLSGIPELDRLLAAARAAGAASAGGGAGGGGRTNGGGGPPAGTIPPNSPLSRRRQRLDEAGNEVGRVDTTERNNQRRRLKEDRIFGRDDNGNEVFQGSVVTEQFNRTGRGLRRARREFIDDQLNNRRNVEANITDTGVSKGVRFQVEQLEAVTRSARAANGEMLVLDRTILEINTKTQQAVQYNVRNEKAYTRLRKEKEQEAAILKKFEEHDQRTAFYLKQKAELQARGLKLLSEEENLSKRITQATFAGRDAEGRSFRTTLTNAEGRELKTKTTYAKEGGNKQEESDAILSRNRAKFQELSNKALADGFIASAPKMVTAFDALGRSVSTVSQEFSKATQVGLGKYKVELRSIEEATGSLKEKTLVGGAAIRYMGDSFLTAIGKVQLWTAATSAVFLAIQAMKQAAAASQELENNTIFLARVGGGLSRVERQLAKDGNEVFKQFVYRREAARSLTQELLSLSTATGADAIASQRAAAIFARAGQDREETILSVKATLLAAKIAELDVVDAANLLSAAMLQFNLKARDLLPTLDTLNELSNTYRVTTNDLLQSISRTGSVIEAQGGRLSELAAVTAIVSQRTSRSGAEIGNAIKTISSRLVSPEVAKSIEEVGISLRNQDGTARSLSEVMLELKSTFASLTLAERDQLTVGIAGVRQRNILISAIEGSVDSIIAEIDVLKRAGSAEEEFEESSTTLQSAVQRLTNTLIQFVSVTGGPVAETIKDVINVLQVFLSLLNSDVGQVTTKLLLFAAAFYAIDKAVNKFRTNVKASALDTKALAAAVVGSTNAMNSAATATPSRMKAMLTNPALRAGLSDRLAATETQLAPMNPVRRLYNGSASDSWNPKNSNSITGFVQASYDTGGRVIGNEFVSNAKMREKAIAGLEKSQTFLNRTIMSGTQIASKAKMVFNGFSSSVVSAGKSALSMATSFVKANWVALAITTAIALVSASVGKAAEKYAVYGAAIETQIQTAEKAVVAEEKKATATKVAAAAILQQVAAIEKINNAGGTGADDKIKSIESDIRRIAAAANIVIPVTFDYKSKTAAEDFRKLANAQAIGDANNQANALEALNKKRIEENKIKGGRLGEIDLELENRNRSNARLQNTINNGGPQAALAAIEKEDNETAIKALTAEQAKLNGEIVETNGELSVTGKKIRELREGADFIRANGDELAKMEQRMKAAGDAAIKLRENSKFTVDLGKALDPDSMAPITKNLIDQQTALEKLDDELSEYQKKLDGKDFLSEDQLKNWEDQRQEVIELTRDIAKMRAERDRKDLTDNKLAIGGLITNRNVLADRAGRDPALAGVAGLLDLKAERNSILSQAESRANGLDASGGDKSIADKYALQQNLLDLKEKELALAKELQNSEAKIAEERTKSTKELQKSLGAMSAEDKIRFETALNYFEKNPDAKITTSQLFAGDSASNNIIQGYFADKVVQDPDDPLAKRLAATVRTPEQAALDKEQKAIDDIKGGRSTDEFVNDQVRAAQDAVNRIRELQGQSALIFDEELANSLANTPITVDLSRTADALTGVIDRLATGFDDSMSKQVESLRQYVDSKVANLRVNPNLRVPGGHAPD